MFSRLTSNPNPFPIAPVARTAFGKAPRSLVRLLRNSTIGVALFDKKLHCKACNGALGRIIGVSAKKPLGNRLPQVFSGGAPRLEPAFRRVWTTRDSLSNLELTAQLSPGSESRRWVVNLYPISDASGRVRLVAATFSEVTKGRGVELKLSRLQQRFHSDGGAGFSPLEGELSSLSARTFEVVNRSVALLRGSLSLRFHMSEVRLEADLLQHALFMTPSPLPESSRPQHTEDSDLAPAAEDDAWPAQDQRSAHVEKPDGCALSPRETEILCLLADGKSSKEIGSALDISSRTVECYRARTMLKLKLHSTAELVRYAIRNKIVEA